MKRIFLSLLMLVGTFVPMLVAQNQAESIYQNNISSVVRVFTTKGCGTGFFVAKDLIATNVHVIQGESEVEVETKNSPTRYHIKGYVAIDEAADLVILKVEGIERNPLKLSNLGVREGQDVFVIGAPKCLSLGITRGSVNRIESGYIGFDATVNPGNSGGPIMNQSGEVVGITVMKMNGEGLNFGIPSEKLQYLVNYRNTYPIPLPIATVKENPNPTVNRKSNTNSGSSNYDRWLKLAQESFTDKDYTQAIEYYTKCINERPTKETLVNRAICFSLSQEQAKALNDCNNALKIDADYSLALFIRASIQLGNCNFNQALRDVNHAIENSEEAFYYNFRGELYLRKYELEKAKSDFEHALVLDPNHEGATQNLEKYTQIQLNAATIVYKAADFLEKVQKGEIDEESIDYYYFSFYSGKTLHEGVALVIDNQIGVMNIRYISSCTNKQTIVKQTLSVSKLKSNVLILKGFYPQDVDTEKAEVYYNTDNLVFNLDIKEAINLSGEIRTPVTFRKLTRKSEINAKKEEFKIKL